MSCLEFPNFSSFLIKRNDLVFLSWGVLWDRPHRTEITLAQDAVRLLSLRIPGLLLLRLSILPASRLLWVSRLFGYNDAILL